jgi:Tol biopolymer transport system component
MSTTTLPPAPPRPPDLDELEALIKEARRRARRRRALYGASALLAIGAVVAGFRGFNGGGGHARTGAPAKPGAPGPPLQSRAPQAVKNGPLALIDGLHPQGILLIGPRGRFLRSLPICREPKCGEVTGAAWSPDGRLLAYGTTSAATLHPKDGLHLFDLARNKDRLLSPGYANWQDLAWSRDGTRLAYVTGANVEIMRITQPQRPRELKASATSPSWSPSGKLIAYDRYHGEARGEATWGIWVSRPDGSHVRRLSKWGHAPAWSPGGKLIAYSVRCGIRLMTPTGKDVTPFSAWNCLHIGLPGTPVWSPDGRKLAFSGRDGVYVMSSTGSGLTKIWDGSAMEPAWRPIPR